MDLKKVKRAGVAAAYEGGKVLREHFGTDLKVAKKGPIDLVTEADTGSEAAIVAAILKVFPDHTILAEEGGLTKGDTSNKWIIDPLDGTTNFAHRLAFFSVSIAFSRNDEIVIGIVLNPISGELFTAVAGEGATLNGVPIEVSNVAILTESLLVAGFPYNAGKNFQPLMRRFENCLLATQGVRRLGSAALDLCHVACGRFEGFWEQNLNPWDTAAGMLIAREAGGIVTDFGNRPFSPDQKEILATNGKIHKKMLGLLEDSA